MRRSLVSFAAIATLFTAAACGDDSNEKTSSPVTTTIAPAAAGTTVSAASGNIVQVAQNAGTFATLVKAVQTAGLVNTLSGPGPFTVFAPTDAAFSASLQSLGITADALLADKDKLTKILTYHVLPTKALAADVVKLNGQDVVTVNGAKVKVKVDGSIVTVNDAKVTKTDVAATNGIIHVIDKVLIPTS